MGKKSKSILEVIDDVSVWSKNDLALMTFAKHYYMATDGDVFTAGMPKKLREAEKIEPINYPVLKAIPSKEQALGRSKKQMALFALLSQKELHEKDVIDQGFSRSVIKGAMDKGAVVRENVTIEKNRDDWLIIKEQYHDLNNEQEVAIKAIEMDAFKAYLLYGVTGSGKTEVYMHLIRQVLKSGKNVLVLVPEIGLTPQLITRFTNRFNCPTAILNSGLNDTQRAYNWNLAAHGQAGIVIGTRSSVFVPIPDLGLVIVDEEHDGSFKQDTRFAYNGRDLAIAKANYNNCPVVLGSATPSLESWVKSRRTY